MPNVWNIGNTTVRNPKRIENGLKVFVEEGFSGNSKGFEIEQRLHEKLKDRGVLEFDGSPSDWNGRKWRAAFYQLGFISYEDYVIEGSKLEAKELFNRIGYGNINLPYQLTLSGQKLIKATSIPEIDDIYTRQFCSYELPNSLEGNFPEGCRMKPFILFLQVLLKLKEKNLEGLSKYETGLFLQRFRNHNQDLPDLILSEVVEFRKQINDSTSLNEVRAIKEQYRQELKNFSGIDPSSIIRDYADTTFRYFSLSGLFARKGERIIIRQNKIRFVNQLLLAEPLFLFADKPLEFFTKFYTNSYPIPTDDPAIALEEVEYLKKGIKNQNHALLKEANKVNTKSSFSEIQKIRYSLIEYNNWEREEDFAIEQKSSESVSEILAYLKVLNNDKAADNIDIDDRPAYLEWAVWRSFLAINDIKCPVHETRRFPVDQDFKPRNTAPGGGSDLLFEFETYVLAVEVTLTVSHRQMAVESEPVRRHTVQYKDLYRNKDVYCLFIAPDVDNNVAETFRIGVWYDKDDEEFVNIIPMNLRDFILAIEGFHQKPFENEDFKNLLDRCLIYRNVRAPQWKKYVSREICQWRTNLSKRV